MRRRRAVGRAERLGRGGDSASQAFAWLRVGKVAGSPCPFVTFLVLNCVTSPWSPTVSYTRSCHARQSQIHFLSFPNVFARCFSLSGALANQSALLENNFRPFCATSNLHAVRFCVLVPYKHRFGHTSCGTRGRLTTAPCTETVRRYSPFIALRVNAQHTSLLALCL